MPTCTDVFVLKSTPVACGIPYGTGFGSQGRRVARGNGLGNGAPFATAISRILDLSSFTYSAARLSLLIHDTNMASAKPNYVHKHLRREKTSSRLIRAASAGGCGIAIRTHQVYPQAHKVQYPREPQRREIFRAQATKYYREPHGGGTFEPHEAPKLDWPAASEKRLVASSLRPLIGPRPIN